MSGRNGGRGGAGAKTEGEQRRNILVVRLRGREEREGRGLEEELQESARGAEGKTVCGAAGGRGRPYTANPRQPHSITMLSRIQMTVISFGTPYT